MPADKLAAYQGPGFFCVLSEPGDSLPVDEYHHWYNTEHGPARLRLDNFATGFRYKSRGREPPVWLACYELKRVSGLTEPQYTVLREKRSERERHVLQRMKYMDRRIYTNVSSRGVDKSPAPILLAVTMYVRSEHVDEVDRWYEEVRRAVLGDGWRGPDTPAQEHLDDIAHIPGWIRSRRFRRVAGEGLQTGVQELLALHEFEQDNGLDGREHQYAKSRPWRLRIVNKVIEGKNNKIFDFAHAFKAQDYQAPSPLNGFHHVSRPTTGATTWRLDGCDNPQAPLVVFSNSVLTDFHIWDATLVGLMRAFPGFRFLRYNTRGYEAPLTEPVTIDVLAEDLAGLLDTVGVQKCFAVVGVSLGGITCINFAVRFAARLEKYIACDCNIASSADNTQAWNARIALARSEGGWTELANQTVRRWFTAASVESETKATADVRRMIASASGPGFANCVAALCDFDLSEELQAIQIPGLYVVGECDGVLPQAMASFATSSPRASLVQVPGAGHLPMVEQPEAFTDLVRDFLRSS